jgi:hypothetical protein
VALVEYERGNPGRTDLKFHGNRETGQDALDTELWAAIHFAREEAVRSSLLCVPCQSYHHKLHPKLVEQVEGSDIPCDDCREFHYNDHEHADCLAVQCLDEVIDAVQRYRTIA